MEKIVPWLSLISVLIVLFGVLRTVMTRADCERSQGACRTLQAMQFAQGKEEFVAISKNLGAVEAKIDGLCKSFHRLELADAERRGAERKRATDREEETP